MKSIVEYVWIDAKNTCRSKSKVIENLLIIDDKIEFPEWNFDGSSTGQSEGQNSEIILKPCCAFTHSLLKNIPTSYSSYLVLCDCYFPDGQPISSNTRYLAKQIFDSVKNEEPWFGIEQEYVLIDNNMNNFLGWPQTGLPEKQGKYYCGNGCDRSFGRTLVEEHYMMCLSAGIKICGINQEVMPSQWEFQIGICEGIEAADHLMMARFLLIRCAEKYNIKVSFEPKPIDGDWNGSGCHTNFSTRRMRTEIVGFNEITIAIEKLSKSHSEHLKVYGDNSKRLSGTHETSSFDKFTSGVGDRSASIRIPSMTLKNMSGYIEDRRPASDCDPYLVTAIMAKTVLLD